MKVNIPETDKPRVVVIGAGFAGLQLVKKLKGKGFQVVLVDRNNYHTFQPLLYQVATSGLEPDSIAAPVRKLFANYPHFHFRMADVKGIDADNKALETSVGTLYYDHLVLATGSNTNYFGKKETAHYSMSMKSVPEALDLRSLLLQNLESALVNENEEERALLMKIVIVGGGPTGVEMSGALAEMKKHVFPKDYPDLDMSHMEIYLLEAADQLLLGMSRQASDNAKETLEQMGVNVRLNAAVDEFDGKVVTLTNGETIESATVIWSAGVKGNVIPGLPEDSVEKNRVLVDGYNQVRGMDNVYAIGDLAAMTSDELPKGHPMLAPVAIQQGQHLADNLVRAQKGRSMEPFEYKDQGTMATIGRNKAVADLWGTHFKGLPAWVIWMFVHLLQLVGFRNRLVVFINWVWNYFNFDRSVRLIIRPFSRKKQEAQPKEKAELFDV